MASGRENEPMLLYWGWVPVNSTVRDWTPLEEGWGWDKQSLTEPPCRSEPLPDKIISARVKPAFVNALQFLKPGSSWKLISSAQSCFFSRWVEWWAIAFPQREGQNYVSLFCINSSATSAGARWSLKKKKKSSDGILHSPFYEGLFTLLAKSRHSAHLNIVFSLLMQKWRKAPHPGRHDMFAQWVTQTLFCPISSQVIFAAA